VTVNVHQRIASMQHSVEKSARTGSPAMRLWTDPDGYWAIEGGRSREGGGETRRRPRAATAPDSDCELRSRVAAAVQAGGREDRGGSWRSCTTHRTRGFDFGSGTSSETGDRYSA
jgi:hypothetical protein